MTATGTGTVTYTARLATAPTDTVTVTPTSTSGAIATVSPTTGRSFTSTNYSTPQTFTVTGVTTGTTSITHAAASTSDANYQITAAGSVAVTVNADLTNVATLSSLTGATSADGSAFSGAVALIPVFASATTTYTASVPNTVTHVRFTPTATAGSGATVEVGLGSSLSSVVSGSASSALALTVGVNTVNVKVTAADGTTTQTYAVTLTRRTVLPANSVRMVSATPGDGTVAAVWEMASGVCFVNLRYRVVDTDTNQSGDQPGPWRSHSADSSTGNTCDATTSVTTPASDAPQLYNGHLYEIQVLGKQSGTTTETAWSASVQFTPAAVVSASLALSALSVVSSDVTEIYDNTLVLNPAFAADTVYYVANDLAGTETSVQITPTVATSGSTVKVGFKGATLTAATSGSASTLVLPVGYSVIAVEVTDTNSNTATYQVAVLRLAVPANTTATAAALNGTPAITFGSDAAGRSGYEVSWQVKDASETWGERTTALDVSSSVITGSAATVSGNTVGGFVPGATVHVRMHFTDTAGRPHWSRFGTGTPIGASSEPITVTLWNVPGKPTSVKALATTANDDDLTLEWVAPTNTGGAGAAITGYKVRWRVKDANPNQAGDQPGAWNNSGGVDTASATPAHVADNLSTDTVYEIQVRALNGVNPGGAWSNTVEGTTSALVPPSRSVLPGDTELTATWGATTRVYTAAKVRYRVKDTNADMSGDQPGAWQTTAGTTLTAAEISARSVTVPVSTTRCATCTAMVNGTVYEVQMQFSVGSVNSAWTSVGDGTPSQSTKTVSILNNLSVAEQVANAEISITLGEAAPAGGVVLNFAYDYSGSDATTADTGTTRATLTVTQGQTEAALLVPLNNDNLVENDETFTVTVTTTTSDWRVNSAMRVTTVTITDDDADNAKIAFGASATATTELSVSVAENGSTLNIPVTASHRPQTSTTIEIEVLTTGTTAATSDYSITTKSVTFAPTDTNLTKNLAVSITDNSIDTDNKTIKLRIKAADDTVDDLGDHYTRHTSGSLATVTISDDDTAGVTVNETARTVVRRRNHHRHLHSCTRLATHRRGDCHPHQRRHHRSHRVAHHPCVHHRQLEHRPNLHRHRRSQRHLNCHPRRHQHRQRLLRLARHQHQRDSHRQRRTHHPHAGPQRRQHHLRGRRHSHHHRHIERTRRVRSDGELDRRLGVDRRNRRLQSARLVHHPSRKLHRHPHSGYRQ